MFSSVRATAAEKAAARPGDQIVTPADVIMDRAFTVEGAPAEVWPWLAQLARAGPGGYLPRSAERFLPRGGGRRGRSGRPGRS